MTGLIGAMVLLAIILGVLNAYWDMRPSPPDPDTHGDEGGWPHPVDRRRSLPGNGKVASIARAGE